MTFEKPFSSMFSFNTEKFDGSGSTATTFAPLLAAIKVYRPMCAPTSTTISPGFGRNHLIVAGSCEPANTARSVVRGLILAMVPDKRTVRLAVPGIQYPLDLNALGIR